MKASKFFFLIITMIILLSISSCSSEKNTWFQSNDPPSDFNLFKIFDNYPSIHEAWDKVQKDVFNQGMAELINNTPVDQLKEVLGLIDDLVEPSLKPTQPLFKTLDALREMIDTIVHQDNLDEGDTATYYDDFISLMDKLSASRANFSRNLVPIVADLIAYINRVHGSEIVAITYDLLYLLQEHTYDNPGAQNLYNLLPDIQESLSKLLIRNDDYMNL